MVAGRDPREPHRRPWPGHGPAALECARGISPTPKFTTVASSKQHPWGTRGARALSSEFHRLIKAGGDSEGYPVPLGSTAITTKQVSKDQICTTLHFRDNDSATSPGNFF